ncbi:myosin-11-like [Periophthalmus magnuspinnatus]|uniref:myosin-11-like n=1 Tax=Periophthalmus magnuspinnatus TaxID=409849 RepID=UPI0024368DF2|nr:myosin-11-like [Periophthalmus magnuspinnatus]
MYRPERNNSPFSLLDMDMWDTNLTAQSSSWCGMATVSGSGFLSKVNTSSSGGAGSFRPTDPGLRKWQSLSHLAPNVSPRSFSPSPQSDLRSGRGQSPFRQTGVMQWLQEAQERMDSHMDLLQTERRSSANLLDMKPKERQTSGTELFKLNQALREAETRAKRYEEECAEAILKLQTATETQKALLNQTIELKQKLVQTLQNQSELEDQLREANNKISQACLEQATMSTQMLKLESNVLEQNTKLKAAQHNKDNLTQEKADLQEKINLLELQLEKSTKGSQQQNGLDHTDHQETTKLKQEVAALRKLNEDLSNEFEEVKQALKKSQVNMEELRKEDDSKSQKILDLEKECAALRSRIQTSEQESLEEQEEQIKQLRESLRSVTFEKQKQQDHCLFLETAVFEKEQQLKLLEENYCKIDAGRVQHIEELKVMVSHWTDKWQKAALTVQSADTELEELRRKNKNESESYLRLELNACKQELELVKSRSQAFLNKTNKDGADTVQTQDRDTMTDPCLLSETPVLDLLNHKDKQLEIKTTGCDEVVEDCTNAQINGSLKVQLIEREKTEIQLEQETTQALQELESSRQFKAKEEEPSAKERSKVNFDTEQQRRLVNEQLKSLFKEREENEMTSGDRLAQDWVQMSRGTRSAHDRWSWHQGTGLTPVFEEEEPGDEDQEEKMQSC